MKRILIIEDDGSFAESLKATLAQKYQVELCQDGQSGYYAIYEYKPDAVLISLTIAQMDAVSLVGKMRVQKQFSKLPIHVLADSTTAARADDALAAGANEAFLKDESGAINSITEALDRAMTPSLGRRFASGQVVTQPQVAPVPALAAALVPVGATVPAQPEPKPIASGVFTAPIRRTEPSAKPRESKARVVAPFDRSFAPSDTVEEHSVGQFVNSREISQFLDRYGSRAHSIRQDFIRYRTAREVERPALLGTLLQKLASLNKDTTQSGLPGLGRYLHVIECRVRQLSTSTAPASPSSLQGLAAALDALAALNNLIGEIQPLNNLEPLALVVDDDPVSRKTLSLGLEKSNIKTTAVDNPDAALLEVESKPFDLIFLDVDLPKMNGFALCARIRITPAHRKTPILFVTSLNDIKSRASSRVSGGNEFITKPVNLYDLGINSWSLLINRRILQHGEHAAA